MSASVRKSYGHEQAERDYNEALAQFRELRTNLTRTAVCGRKFVLVPSVTAALCRKPSRTIDANAYKNDLDRLRALAYVHKTGEWAELPLESLDTCAALFYTLLDLDHPHLIHLFYDVGFRDHSLPISEAQIRAAVAGKNASIPSDFYAKFYAKQYEWCPVMLEADMPGKQGDRIVPIYRISRITSHRDGQRSLSSGDSAIISAIEVPEELVEDKIKRKLPDSGKMKERDVESGDHTDRNPGPVCTLHQNSPPSEFLQLC